MSMEEIGVPAALAVSLADAKVQLRIDLDELAFDGQLAIWIAGIAAEAEHETGRKFVNRRMRVTLDRFPGAIKLSAPTYSVESVKFTDVEGDEWLLDPADYYVDKASKPGYVMPAPGRAWPATARHANVVVVDYTAGHGPDSAATPAAAKLYILARLVELWDPATKEFRETVRSNFAKRLLDGLRVY